MGMAGGAGMSAAEKIYETHLEEQVARFRERLDATLIRYTRENIRLAFALHKTRGELRRAEETIVELRAMLERAHT